MAIVFKGLNLKIDSGIISGVMGDWEKIFNKLNNANISFYNPFVKEDDTLSKLCDNNKLAYYLKELCLDEGFITREYHHLSCSEKCLFKYLILFTSKKKILVLYEPMLYLDSFYQKKILVILKRLVYRERKTIIMGSYDSDLIYQICKKVLLIKNNDFLYDYKEKVFYNTDMLKKYDIIEPQIVQFIRLAREKGKKLSDVDDIRDLIKEVYRHV